VHEIGISFALPGSPSGKKPAEMEYIGDYRDRPIVIPLMIKAPDVSIPDGVNYPAWHDQNSGMIYNQLRKLNAKKHWMTMDLGRFLIRVDRQCQKRRKGKPYR